MINCLIVDDEPLAIEIIEGYINLTDGLQLSGKCSNAQMAFEALHINTIDLILLDIKMPEISGLDFIKSLKNPPAVIFTTAYSEYAADSYELEAVDYLLKPITYERFRKAIDKCLKLKTPTDAEEKHYTYFKVSGVLIKVFHADILFVQSIKDYLLIHTLTENFIVHMTMKYISELLPFLVFNRVHRSYLINNSHISSISKDYILILDNRIPIGESYRKPLADLKNTFR
ncbi:LytR/AlgR family response regulator transcription factor [Pedobacter jamesrossensis]|uniref:LytR/AlgR family response regulator transcription factor n=1 Tax=Pedobacter jamesrossensis TaxID=1908238 RepID=A0ABV8NR18_9SPHI